MFPETGTSEPWLARVGSDASAAQSGVATRLLRVAPQDRPGAAAAHSLALELERSERARSAQGEHTGGALSAARRDHPPCRMASGAPACAATPSMLEHRALADTVTAAGPGVAFIAGYRGEASEQEPPKVSSNASAPTFSQKRVRRRRRQTTFSPGLAVWRGAQPLAARTPAQAPALLAASAPPTEPGGTGRSEEARRRCECSSHCRADEHSNRGHRNLAKRGCVHPGTIECVARFGKKAGTSRWICE